MRALRIVVRDSLHPHLGSAVDVLVTFDPTLGGADPAVDDGVAGSTVIAARGVLVLGTDDEPAVVDAGDTGPAGGLGVTLLVTPAEAERLAQASATGAVTLALVPPEDAARTP